MNAYTHALTLPRAGIITRGKRLTKHRRHKIRMVKLYTILTAIMAAAAVIGYFSVITEKEIENAVEARSTVQITKPAKTYAYNERVPAAIVKTEISDSARRFRLNEKEMHDLADCESKFNNLAENPSPNSSACGVYQFVAQTWIATDSFTINRIACTDYKANIYEAHKKLARGEYSHWRADPKVITCMRGKGHKNW